MDFLKILKSFDELLFELMSWLVFYPLTMARILARPLSMMRYSDSQFELAEEGRYDEGVSPPLLLMITLVIASAVALAVHAADPVVKTPLAELVHKSQENELLFRCLTFALIPLVAATTLVRRRKQVLSRGTLHAPFYAQCYLAAPSALAVSISADAMRVGGETGLLSGFFAMILATLWFLTVQTRWFMAELKIGWLNAAFTATWAFVRSAIYLVIISLPLTQF